MSAGRLELKVGLFMFVCLALAAALSIRFSETKLGLEKTYPIKMEISSAGTLVPDAKVMMAGVEIGFVKSIDLASDGLGAVVGLRIYENYPLHENDQFTIKSVGFMGDMFVSVTAGAPSRGNKLSADALVEADTPFDFFEAAIRFEERFEQFAAEANQTVSEVGGLVGDLRRTVAGINQEVVGKEGLVAQLQQSVTAINEGLLSETNFAKLNRTINEIQTISSNVRSITAELQTASKDIVAIAGDVKDTTRRIDQFMTTNSATFGAIVANVQQTTVSVNKTVRNLEQMIATSQPGIIKAIDNIQAITVTLDTTAKQLEKLLAENKPVVGETLENVRGLTGNLKDTSAELKATLSANRKNVEETLANLRDVSADMKSAVTKIDSVMKLVVEGKGLAGSLFSDDKMKNEFMGVMTNMQTTLREFGTVASNINKHGILWWRGERVPVTNKLQGGSVGKPFRRP
ncbi:MAG: hypothetical protein CMO64_03955 [Verrucomicrobiales bacterium]|nr:hypothetical protein [Verrucomicrobiales bacterium]